MALRHVLHDRSSHRLEGLQHLPSHLAPGGNTANRSTAVPTMLRVRCLERRGLLTSLHDRSVLRLGARPPVGVVAAAGAPPVRPKVAAAAAAAAAARDPPSVKKSRQTAHS